jgi:hypothetical protein
LPIILRLAISEESEPATSAAPTKSMSRLFLSSERSNKDEVKRTAKPKGMLIQNNDLHPRETMSHPPRFGPIIHPIGKILLNSPIARCLESGNASATIPVAEGRIPEPPSAWMKRKKISSSMLGATLHNNEPKVNKMTQDMKVDFLPRTSLTFPARGNEAVSTN